MDLNRRIQGEIMGLVCRAQNHRIRPFELERTLKRRFGFSSSVVRDALKSLILEERLAYLYRDPCSYVEIAFLDEHPAARPMKIVVDARGESWICDSRVDPSGDLEQQGCWRCKDMPFKRAAASDR